MFWTISGSCIFFFRGFPSPDGLFFAVFALDFLGCTYMHYFSCIAFLPDSPGQNSHMMVYHVKEYRSREQAEKTEKNMKAGLK
jgi:hypothetical protein